MEDRQRHVEEPRSAPAYLGGAGSGADALSDQLGALAAEVRGLLSEAASQSQALNEAAREATGGQ